MPRETRYDLHRFDAVEEMASGELRIPARVARVGVLHYQDAEGNMWGEFVPPETLFAADSMATLRGVALTDLHPGSGLVTPTTRKALAVGHASDDVRRDGIYLSTPLYVTDGDEIALVKRGERKDTSSAYTCDFDETPGVYDGVPYRRVQRDRVYNHVGLGPEGWGRAGKDVSLRMDGAAVLVPGPAARMDSAHATSSARSADSKTTGGTTSTKEKTMLKLKIKGREFKLDADDDVKSAQGAVDEVQSKADADGAELTAVKNALMDALKLVAALEAKLAVATAAEPPAVTEESVPETVADALVAKRIALRARAAAVLPTDPKATGYVKLDGLKADEIKRKVVAHAHPTMKLDGMKSETIDGMFLAVTEGAMQQQAKRADGTRRASEVLTPDAQQAAEVAREDGNTAEAFDPIADQQAALRSWSHPSAASGSTSNGTAGKN